MIYYVTKSSEVLGLVCSGFVIAFTMSVGMGANDVANAFGTTYGAKIMTIMQIIVVASIFEIAGAMLIGTQVAETLRKGIVDVRIINKYYLFSPDCKTLVENASSLTQPQNITNLLGCSEMMQLIGAVSSLSASSIWMFIANVASLPVSTTHSIVGSMIGYGLVCLRGKGINWYKLLEIVISWFLSPVCSGIITICLWLFIYHFIIKRRNSFEQGLKILPIFYFVTFFIVLFSIFYNGTPLLYFDKIPVYGVFILCIGLSLVGSALVKFVQVPILRRKFSSNTNQAENPTPDIIITDGNTNFDKDKNSIYDENQKEAKKTLSAKGFTEEDHRISIIFRYMQIIVACYGSFAHGGNDVSNSVAPLITIWLIYTNRLSEIPSYKDIWLMAFGAIGIVIGLAIWGKRVLETVGNEITTILPSMAYSIELGSVLTVVVLTRVGLPVSTTHCKIGSVILLGMVKYGIGSVNKDLIVKILLSWFVTVPVSAMISAFFFSLINAFVYGL